MVISPEQPGERDPARARFPSAPPGAGPVLEWFQESNSNGIKSGIFVASLIAAFLSLKDWGFDWTTTWGLWAFVLAPIPIFYLYSRSGGLSAGSDWFATSRRRHVQLYELTKVTVTNPAGVDAWVLELTDRNGGFTGAKLREVQQNRALWDLVYNGIVHSVNSGTATANELALDKLELR
ncbi:hypothetical protein GCM10020366_17980 [Saccharopolyspora gregorii]|uniref:PH domain-containing protein n=1 Tax=Saccharopolyspora gregorii TaxID=33914 RepID=A0ABP6RLG4_9PSEU